MLHQCPCGGIVRCNGRFDGGQQADATRPHDLSVSGFPGPTYVLEILPTTGLAISSGDRPSNALPFSGVGAAKPA
jgi:hypothetical protein